MSHIEIYAILFATCLSTASLDVSAAQFTVQSSDLLGTQIYQRFEPSVPAPLVVDGVTSASRTQVGMYSAWSVRADFVSKASAWQLMKYSLAYDVEVAQSAQKGGDEAPPIPNNPQAPSGGGNIGDTASNTMQQGDWSISFNYTYGVRDGVLGWHLTSVTATYRPKPKPVNIVQ